MERNDENLQSLRERFAGRIRVGNTGREYLKYVAAMEELLTEWSPVGKSVEDVEFVIGPPSRRLDDDLVYLFEDGWGGRGWIFRVQDDAVVAIENMRYE